MSIFRCAECGRINRIKATDVDAGTATCGQCKSVLDTSGKPQEVNTAQFKRAIRNAPVPVLLDVWAPWCGPCRMVAPVLESIGKERAGELMILKVNSDENQQLSSSLKISGIPTMLLFEDGKESARQSGAMPKPNLDAWLRSQGVSK